MSGPAMNRVVADFSADATGDQKIRLKDLRGQNVVIYFYPKDSTPGCTQEGLDFKELHARFRRQKTVILGVSRDRMASHEKFRAKQGFPFELLSDPDEAVREEAVNLIADHPDGDIETVARIALRDPSPRVREAVEEFTGVDDEDEED